LTIFFTRDSNTTLSPAVFNVTDYSSAIDLTGMLTLSLVFIYLAKKRFAWPEWGYLLAKIERPATDEGDFGFEEYKEYDEYEDDND
jgi:hypothetical protein